MSTETTEITAWQVDGIINAANDLRNARTSTASTSQHIAGAFVLNRMDLLPSGYSDVIEAWDRLDDWQPYVRQIKQRYMHLVG